MEVTKTVKAKVIGLSKGKREALLAEYLNYQMAFQLSEALIEELGIKSLKRATDLLYKKESDYSLTKQVQLYSAAYQMAYKKALCPHRKSSKKEQPLRLRNDTFDVKRFENSVATYWARIPVYGNHGGIKVALAMSPNNEELLCDPNIKTCDSEIIKRENDFFLHPTVKKCVDITPSNSGRLAVIGIDAGIKNTATSVVWRDDRITGVTMHSGKRLAHKVRQMKARLAKQHTLAFTHNSYPCVVKALDKETELGRGLSNYTMDCLHKISASIVEQALDLRAQGYDVAIACEDLKHIRKRMSGKLHWWAFRKLFDLVKYKAQWAGIQVIEVEPANTSRTCPRCGHCERGNRSGANFKCTECEYNANSDLVGASNVARRSLGFHELHACGNGRCESAREVALVIPKAMMLEQTRRRSGL